MVIARFFDASCSQDRLVTARHVELLGALAYVDVMLIPAEKAFASNELMARQPMITYTRRGMVDGLSLVTVDVDVTQLKVETMEQRQISFRGHYSHCCGRRCLSHWILTKKFWCEFMRLLLN